MNPLSCNDLINTNPSYNDLINMIENKISKSYDVKMIGIGFFGKVYLLHTEKNNYVIKQQDKDSGTDCNTNEVKIERSAFYR